MDSPGTDLLVANVVAMRSTQVGDYVYRVSQPSLALGRLPGVKVVTVGTVSPYLQEIAARADVLVLHLLSEDDLFPVVYDRRLSRKPTVFEISDHFAASHAGVGIQGWFADPVNRSNAFQLLRLADATQVTGAGLLERFGALNARTTVFENQIERVSQKLQKSRAQVRIGWAGSAGHTEDLRQIEPVLSALCNRFPQVTFCFMGNERQFDDVFSRLPAAQRSYTPPGTLDAYYTFLEGLDVGLAPLLPNPYNECRSDVKFVEYASRGVVPVLSAVTPYLQHVVHGETGFLYRSPAELGQVLDRVVTDARLRARVASKAFAYVREARLESQHAEGRLQFYRSLASEAPPHGPLEIPLQRSGADDSSESYDVQSTVAEHSLVAGIQLDAIGASEAARARYQEARADAPAFDLPLFWLGRSHELRGEKDAARDWFGAALEKNPRSLRAALHFARLTAARDPRAALKVMETSLAHAPAHAPTLEAMARLHEDLGAHDQAISLYQTALLASPHFGRVATRLGRLYQSRGDLESAGRMFDHASELAPLDPEGHVDCAELLFAQGRVVPAARRCIRALDYEPKQKRAHALLGRLISAMEAAKRVG
jgi:tetratricopeptide (TPR) repeat protein